MIIADELAVRVHGEDVGALALLRDGRVMFAFDPAFAQGRDRPTVSLSFLGGSGEARAGTQTFARGGRVPPYLSNLLPEGHLRSYLAAKAGVKRRNITSKYARRPTISTPTSGERAKADSSVLRSHRRRAAQVLRDQEYPLLRPVVGDMPGAVEVRTKTDDGSTLPTPAIRGRRKGCSVWASMRWPALRFLRSCRRVREGKSPALMEK